MKRLPQHTLISVSFLAFLFVSFFIYLALQVPILGITFQPQDTGFKVVSIDKDSPNHDRLKRDQVLIKMSGIPLTKELLIEEPDQLNEWAAYLGFFAKMTTLNDAAQQNQLYGTTLEGDTLALTVRERKLSDLPLLFWIQAFVGVCGFLIASSVFAFKQRENGALFFAFAGFGLLIFSLAASIYSTREFIIDGQLAHQLSLLNQMGAIFFTASLVALLAVYPQKLRYSNWITIAAFFSGLAIWLGFSLQLFANISIVYLLTLVLFITSFVLAYIQWQQTHSLPVERAALKWYLLSIYLGTGLFAALILVPVSLEIDPPASQGLMFMVFLFMFVGIAMGITRYRLFDLDRWWFHAWSWFLGGLLVIAVVVLLLTVIGLEQDTSLAFSLALIGWLYFPIRQWIFEKIQKKKRPYYQQTCRLIEHLFSAEEPEQLAHYWRQYVEEEWLPLSTELKKGLLKEPYIGQDPQCIYLPYLDNQHHLMLCYPEKGSRLFARDDIASIGFLYALAQQALQGLKMRQQALEEKRRILGDLHDDVGSKLLSLLHRSEDPINSELARSALRDLREVVSQPNEGDWLLSDKLSDWRLEIAERLQPADINLNWQQKGIHLHKISYLAASHVSRILREAISNIIKHAQASTVAIIINITDNQFQLKIQDNGKALPKKSWSEGRGLSNIRFRIEKLHGHSEWSQNKNGGILLTITIPIESL
ncbi:MAG: hypothetical protein COT01_03800 [Piscirickettsiaceae bacterium CG07_land_8_20_14_0_80_44_28]|nr:MAG: hypothetical protein COT01_03800 [Piscirickettsiaceae bacterium CG07_land_8_20_14_0_80_44_28]